MDIRTGEVYVGVKNTRVYKGNATCAEDIVFRGLGGNTNANIIMTPAIRPGKMRLYQFVLDVKQSILEINL